MRLTFSPEAEPPWHVLLAGYEGSYVDIGVRAGEAIRRIRREIKRILGIAEDPAGTAWQQRAQELIEERDWHAGSWCTRSIYYWKESSNV